MSRMSTTFAKGVLPCARALAVMLLARSNVPLKLGSPLRSSRRAIVLQQTTKARIGGLRQQHFPTSFCGQHPKSLTSSYILRWFSQHQVLGLVEQCL